MEETQKKEIVMTNVEIKEEAGEIEIVVDEKAENRCLQDWFKSSREAYYAIGSSTADIPLVPKALREKEELKKYFEPTIISIGPYHHGKVNLKAGELLKLRLTEEFLKLPRDQGEKKEPWTSVRRNIKEFRACYDARHVKEDKYDDETLAWMLFVDGCSVLYYMICCFHGNFIALNLNNSDLAILQQDLILLENQLPYRVLDLLRDGMFYRIEIESFVNKWFVDKPPESEPKGWPRSRFFQKNRTATSGVVTPAEQLKQPSHLLEIMWRTYIAGGGPPSHLLKLTEEPEWGPLYTADWCPLHNVTELIANGISLQPSLPPYGLTDVAFLDVINPFHNPQLLLPPITINNTTKTKLLNLIALEMSSSSSKRNYVTSYICFLNSLISDQDDVKELRAAHILYNFLGSNEELAKFFKGIADHLVPDYGIYSRELYRIDQYLERRRSSIWSWKTEATRIYLRSPWEAISVFAVFLAISVSIVQTYFPIFPLPDKCNKSICKYISNNYGFGG